MDEPLTEAQRLAVNAEIEEWGNKSIDAWPGKKKAGTAGTSTPLARIAKAARVSRAAVSGWRKRENYRKAVHDLWVKQAVAVLGPELIAEITTESRPQHELPPDFHDRREFYIWEWASILWPRTDGQIVSDIDGKVYRNPRAYADHLIAANLIPASLLRTVKRK